MWRDEIDDPEYQDQVVDEKTFKLPDFFHQPITSLRKSILNAVTGQEYPFKIGTPDEYRFFVVMESDPDNHKEARRLFFESPEQYERVTRRVVSEKSKQKFREHQKMFR